MMSIKSRVTAGFAGLVFALGSFPVNAQWAVVDVPHTIESIIGWSMQAAKWADQLEKIAAQYTQLQRTYDTMKNPRAYIRNLAMSALDRQARRYMPANFDEAMSRRYLNSPDPFTSRLRSVMGQYQLREWWEAYNGLPRYTAGQTKSYDNKLRAAQTMMAGSLLTQEHVETRLASVEGLIDAAASADDLKASVDTGSRMTGEVAHLMVENLRMQAQAAYLSSNEAQREIDSEYRALRMSRWRDRSW